MRGLLKFWTYTRKQKENECLYMYMILVISVYLSSLPVAHLSDAPGRRLVLGEGLIVQGYRTRLLSVPHGSVTYSAYSTVTQDLVLTSHLKEN